MTKIVRDTPKEVNNNHDLMVVDEFIAHPNRALSVPEIAILLGGTALNNVPGFDIAASFDRLEKRAVIYRTANERHVGPTLLDEVVISDRYRLVR